MRSDQEIVAALRAGDQDTFDALVDELTRPMLRVAQGYVGTRAAAEEAVQDTWLAVLQGLDRFEGRSSLRTWIFRILMNRAITHFGKERRSIPFSSLGGEDDGPSVDPDRFFPPGHAGAGGWSDPPRSWEEIPEDVVTSGETMEVIRRALAELPERQRAVMVLRDLQHASPREAADILEISEGNQRVLLHRARTKVRRALEQHFDEAGLSVPLG
ncbi:MAG TPA: RNA polymerase sigma factor [Actinomycetota bacterium]|nr:RNA polymerase sigma factor [Actinomycetota bacterium]